MNPITTTNDAALRRRAERDSRKQNALPLPRTDADARRLVHELEVHQIELEMQNVELRHARDDSETTLEKYTDLYDFAPVGYFTLNAEERIRLSNLTGSILVGVERSKLIGRSFGMLLAHEDRSRFSVFCQQVFANEGKQSADFELAVRSPHPRIVTIEGQRLHQGPECNFMMVDITERKRAEEVAHRSEMLFLALIRQSPSGVYVVDSNFCLLQANPIAMRIFQNVHPLVGRNFSEVMRKLWPRKIADQIVGRFQHTLESGESYDSPPFSERRRDTGLTEVYEWQIQRVTLPAGDYGVVCFFDNVTQRVVAEAAQRRVEVLASSNVKLKQEIAQRKLVQEDLRAVRVEQSKLLKQSRLQQKQLRELSHSVLSVQEEERKRISRELHDIIAQTLVGINVHLTALTDGAAAEPENLITQISRTHLLVEKAVDTVHHFARELRPTMLDDLGLIPALETLLEEFMKDTGIRASLKASAGVVHSTGAVRTALYRVVQEALSNVARHSKATRVEVRVEALDGIISLQIEDNGQGFNPKGRAHGRLGLLGMKERVEMVAGTFRVNSAPGEPTMVQASVPMRSGGLKKRVKKTARVSFGRESR